MSVSGNCASDDLLQSCAIAVVTELCRDATHGCADHPVGAIVEVCRTAVVDEVAVVVPGIGLTIHAAQAICGIIGIIRDDLRGDRARLHGAVASPVTAWHFSKVRPGTSGPVL